MILIYKAIRGLFILIITLLSFIIFLLGVVLTFDKSNSWWLLLGIPIAVICIKRVKDGR